MGGCYRVPGLRYKEFVVIGADWPSLKPEEGERLCSTCFGSKQRIAEALEAGPSAEVGSSSESSSSDDGASEAETPSR